MRLHFIPLYDTFLSVRGVDMSKDVNNIGNRCSIQKAVKDVDKEYISNLWKFSMQVRALNTGRVKSEQEMEERIQKLFEICYQTGNMPTYESLAVACGIPSRTFYDMKLGKYEGYKEYSRVIMKAKEQIAMIESAMVRDGKIPPSLWQFRAKNYLGMRDVQQIEAVSNQSGDIPNQSVIDLAELPEAPAIEAEKLGN